MDICIFGSGYVGLVTGACLADIGHNVICVDRDADKIAGLKQGKIPIYEPGLEDKVMTNANAGRLHFTTQASEGVAFADTLFIAVGTPPDQDGSADLTAVLSVATDIATYMTQDKVIVTKSTVPVGSAEKVHNTIADELARLGKDALAFSVASNPEFLKEGSAVADFEKPDRIVIGIDSDMASKALYDIYAPLSRRNNRIIAMDVKSAELTKYAANAMLATKISFMNEISNVATAVGADVEQVRIGIGADSRIGYHFIYPGVGYGGSCFPKDVKALGMIAREHGIQPRIVDAVEGVNEAQKNVLFDKIKNAFNGDLKGKRIALWGLAFKPNTDDMREAPARIVMEALWEAGAHVQAYDPEAMDECRRIYGNRPDLTLFHNAMDAIKGADALTIVTEWREFRAANADMIRDTLNTPIIFDGRNIYEPQAMAERGIIYHSIGRPVLPITPSNAAAFDPSDRPQDAPATSPQDDAAA